MSKLSYLVSVYILMLANYTISIGGIVGTSLSSNPIENTSFIVIAQSIGAIFALIISLKIQSGNKRVLLFGCTIQILTSTLAFHGKPFEINWYLNIFLRSTAGLFVSTSLLAHLRTVEPVEHILLNKKVGIATTLAWLMSFGIGPFVSSRLSVNHVYLLDVFLNFILIIVLYLKGSFKKIENKSEIKDFFKGYSKISYLLWTGFLTYCSAGIFHVLEVSILKEKLSFSTNEITTIFIVTALFDLVAIKLIPIKFLERYSSNLFTFFAIVITILTYTYLHTESKFFIYIVVSLFGLSSGLFSLSQSSMIQHLDDYVTRKWTFIQVNLVTNLAILGACLFLRRANVSIGHLERVDYWVFFAFFLLLSTGALKWLKLKLK